MVVCSRLCSVLALLTVTLGAPAAGSVPAVVAPAEGQTVKLVVKKAGGGTARAQALGFSSVPAGAHYEVVEVPEGEANTTAALLRQQPDVLAVERDLPTAIPTPLPTTPAGARARIHAQAATGTPNDAGYLQQFHWQPQTDTYRGQSDFEAAYLRRVVNHAVNVAVLDGGFTDHYELSWAGGYNFTNGGADASAYLDYDPVSCDFFHGQVVGSIIGAETGNAQSIAGMVDADLYAVRVLNCDGTGWLSDAAMGVRYAAGDPDLGVPVLNARIDVINLSLGASGACPAFMQGAIDYARSKGITVVVAAGNHGADASGFTPANCQGVISVGAVDRFGNQTSFSNFGAAVDISLLGEGVLAPDAGGGDSYYAGTSFAAPIAAGMVAHLRQQERSLTPDDSEALLKAATTEFGVTSKPMGAGVTNGRKLQNLLEKSFLGRKASLKHVLDADDRCDDTLYLEYYQGLFDICSLYEVSTGELPLVPGKHFVLFAVPLGMPATVMGADVVGRGQGARFLVTGIDASRYQYGLQICEEDGTTCGQDELIPLDTSDMATPASCEPDGGMAKAAAPVRQELG